MKRMIAAVAGNIAFAAAVFVLAGTHAAYAGSVEAEEDKKPARGMFLVADPGIGDPRFMERVILLLNIDRTGAAGLIINQPSDTALSRIFPGLKRSKRADDRLYFGGPVEPHRLLMLLRSNRAKKSFARVLDGVSVTTNRAAMLDVLKQASPAGRFRLYAGYAGWAVGQLEWEINRGDWHVLPADADTVFSDDESRVWPDLIRKSSEIMVRTSAGGSLEKDFETGIY